MRSAVLGFVAVVAVIVLAFNPHIIGGPIRSTLNDLKHYNDGPHKSPLPVLKPLNLPDRSGEVPDGELMRPGENKKAPAVKNFGAGAVAIQKAQGL